MGGIKSDKWIKMMATEYKMIEPFEPSQVAKGTISWGLSSYGYDMRLANEYKIFSPSEPGAHSLDPKNLSTKNFIDFKGNVCTIPQNSFVLARSVEYFRIPREILALCFGKSTYARSGIIINVTPLEPGWEGYATIHIANTAPVPALLYSFEGIAQVIFLEADEPCQISYKDRKGKYDRQIEITLPKI